MYLKLKNKTNHFWKSILPVLSFLCCLILFSNDLSAQNTQVDFGRNRVEYKNLEWSFYDKEDYRVYFYLGGQDLAEFVIDIAQNQFNFIEGMLEYKLDEQVQIIVFTDLNDMYQTNINFESNAGSSYNSGGSTKIEKGRLFVYFDGNHANLERQLREGIAALYIHDMLVGGDLQDMIQYAVVLNFPDWYVQGLVAYIGRGWDVSSDTKMRDLALHSKKLKFPRLSINDPEFIGMSFWYYIEQVYGTEALINLLYLVRVNKSIESGYQFITGLTKKEIYAEWAKFYMEGYVKGQSDKQLIDPKDRIGRKTKKRFTHYELKVDSEEKHVAYVRNFLGRYHLKMMEVETGKTKTVLRGGFKSFDRLLDRSFPIVDWNQDGSELTAVYEKKDKTYIMTYELAKKDKKTVKIEKFQKINDFSYAFDDETLILSGTKKGKSDLYFFNIPSHRITQITKDEYDDLNPSYMHVDGKKGIAFVSNRPNDTLNTKTSIRKNLNNYDVFFYELRKDGNRLIQLTNDSSTYPINPQFLNSNFITYTSNEKGIYNQYKVSFDSTFVRNDTIVYFRDSVKVNPIITSANDTLIDSTAVIPIYKTIGKSWRLSNQSKSILESDMAASSGSFYDLYFNKGRYQITKRPFNIDANQDTLNPGFISDMLLPELVVSEDKSLIDTAESEYTGSYSFETAFDTIPEEDLDFTFQTPFEDWEEEEAVELEEEKKEKKPKRSLFDILRKDEEYKRTNIRPYQVMISLQSLTTQMDNAMLFTPYNIDDGNQSMTPFIKATLTDLFEDHVIVGGMKIPTRLNSGEYFVSYENRKKRLDKRIIAYRKSNIESFYFQNTEYFARLSSHILEGRVLWPFSELASYRQYLGARNDLQSVKAINIPSLLTEDLSDRWLFTRSEYVFDNTLELHKNIRTGVRMKFFIEHQRKLGQEGTYMNILGADMRSYQRIHKLMILANRLAIGGSLMSPDNILFVLGGADSWIGAQRDNTTPTAQDMNYQYQAKVTHMRGHRQNVSNGNKYVIFNSEIRLPFVKYLGIPVRSQFLQNFQFIGFADVGAVWVGASPFTEENTLRTVEYPNPNFPVQGATPVRVISKYYRDPIVKGFGTGVRSTLFGYFLKFDIGWGLEGTTWSKPKGMLSLILDF